MKKESAMRWSILVQDNTGGCISKDVLASLENELPVMVNSALNQLEKDKNIPITSEKDGDVLISKPDTNISNDFGLSAKEKVNEREISIVVWIFGRLDLVKREEYTQTVTAIADDMRRFCGRHDNFSATLHLNAVPAVLGCFVVNI